MYLINISSVLCFLCWHCFCVNEGSLVYYGVTVYLVYFGGVNIWLEHLCCRMGLHRRSPTNITNKQNIRKDKALVSKLEATPTETRDTGWPIGTLPHLRTVTRHPNGTASVTLPSRRLCATGVSTGTGRGGTKETESGCKRE